MTGTFRRLRQVGLLCCLTVLGLRAISLGSVAQQRVGVNSAVNPQAMGIPPGGMPRKLVLGQDVVFNERITTETSGQTQVLFVDELTLSVGPNANMVIDQFVYDPNAGTGKLAASLSRGIFRFVGGKISKQDNAVTMRTPAATIGIRGGVMLLHQAVNGSLEAIFVFGKGLTVTGLNGVSKTIFRPGFEVTVAKPGDSPSDPAPAPRGRIAALLAALDGRAGGNGGAPIVPTDVMVANSGIDNSISATVRLNAFEVARLRSLEPVPPTTLQATADTSHPLLLPTTVQRAALKVAPTTGSPEPQVAASAPSTIVPAATNAQIATAANPGLANSGSNLRSPVTDSGSTGGTGGPTGGTGGSTGGTGGSTGGTGGSTGGTGGSTGGTGGSTGGTGGSTGGTGGSTGGTGGSTGGTGGSTGGTGGTGTPVTLTSVAGGYLDTGNQGSAKGFTSALLPYSGGKAVNGTFVATLSPGKTIQFPLVAGTAALDAAGAGTSSPLGPVTGTTYVAADNSFFYANLTPVNQPLQREFIYGGTPVNPQFYRATANTPGYLAFNVQPDAALQSSIPFIRLPTGGSLGGSASVSPLILATPLNTNFSTIYGDTKALQASLAIIGSGTIQQSVIVVLVGNAFGSPADLAGVVHGSYLANAASQPVRINTYFEPPLDGANNRFYGGNSISGFVLAPGASAANAIEVNTATQATAATYQFAQPVTPTPVPQSVASAPQTSQTLGGYFGGIMTKQAPGGSGQALPYAVAGNASITTNASTLQLSATLTGGDPFTSRVSGVPAQNGIVLQFGSPYHGDTFARQAFINDHLFAAFESPAANSSVNGAQASLSTDFAGGTNPNIYLVTQTAAPPPTSLLQNGLCSACQYLQWGYWGGEIDTPAPGGGNLPRTDVGHINFWVAGQPTVNMPTTGVGTFSGAAVGSVNANGASYLAAGNFAQSYDFGKQTGAVSITHFDGANYTGTVGRGATGNQFTGTLSGSGTFGNRSGPVNGGFYGPGAAETGGAFSIQANSGPKYLASGIFAGKQLP